MKIPGILNMLLRCSVRNSSHHIAVHQSFCAKNIGRRARLDVRRCARAMTNFVALAALSGGVMYLVTWAGNLDLNVWEKMPYNFLVRLFSGTSGSSSVIGAGNGANDEGSEGRQPDGATQQRCFPLSNRRSHLYRRIANL